jgi:hypothetical protein
MLSGVMARSPGGRDFMEIRVLRHPRRFGQRGRTATRDRRVLKEENS